MKLRRAVWIDPTEVIIGGRRVYYFCARHGEHYAKGADGLDLFGIPVATDGGYTAEPNRDNPIVCAISVHPFYMIEAADVEQE